MQASAVADGPARRAASRASRCEQVDGQCDKLAVNCSKWRNFPSPEFGTKFPKEMRLISEIPEFPYNTVYRIGRRYDTIRYDTRCYFNVRSKADTSQLNLPHETEFCVPKTSSIRPSV